MLYPAELRAQLPNSSGRDDDAQGEPNGRTAGAAIGRRFTRGGARKISREYAIRNSVTKSLRGLPGFVRVIGSH
jgi:hypothetical protein